tara:strand:+ start:363 stop:542 length:180 start_codon:yes stop_codon:yes gene_type:complete
MDEYYCDVVVKWGGNNFDAPSKKEYRQKVKDSFKEEFGIDLVDDEIINITKSFRIKKNS